MPRMQTQKLFFTGNSFGVIELSNSVVFVGVSYSTKQDKPCPRKHVLNETTVRRCRVHDGEDVTTL